MDAWRGRRERAQGEGAGERTQGERAGEGLRERALWRRGNGERRNAGHSNTTLFVRLLYELCNQKLLIVIQF